MQYRFNEVVSNTKSAKVRLGLLSAMETEELDEGRDGAPNEWCLSSKNQVLRTLKQPTEADIKPILSHTLEQGALTTLEEVYVPPVSLFV